MATYTIRFSVVEDWKATFTADTKEEAEKLLEQVVNEDINPTELPNYEESNKGITYDFSCTTLD